MKRTIFRLLTCFCAGAAAASAMAQQPPDPVSSDALGNTAMGTGALQDQGSIYAVGAYENTAAGYEALASSYNGAYNTAVGAYSLTYNTSGIENTAVGESTLNISQASDNTAVGYEAMQQNVSGSQNTAVGANALQYNLGDGNTAIGSEALFFNTSGAGDAAIGQGSAYNNTTGEYNIAFGFGALYNNDTGNANIAIGYYADLIDRGTNNIDIGTDGSSTDNGVIRIGSPGNQTAAHIAGIERTKVTGSAVYVTSSGQLGVLASSERYKTDIVPISDGKKLHELRPVTFHLKTDPKGPMQYGLIAEEVAHVYPELVIRNDAGVIQGVRYDELAPLLLQQLQQRRHQIAAQDEAIYRLKQEVAKLDAANIQ